jgi:hypothetical protein
MKAQIAHILIRLSALFAARPAVQFIPVPVRRFRRRP